MSPRTRWSPPEQNASGPSPVRTITPTLGSSRARSSASEISIIVCGRNALRTSGRSIVIFAMPRRRRRLLVADVGVLAAAGVRRGPGDAHGAKASLCAMDVEAWLARAAARAPERAGVETPAGERSPTPSCSTRASAARGAAGRARGRGRATASRSRCPPGSDFAVALHACLLLGAVAVPVDLRLAPAERAARSPAGAALVVDEPLDRPRTRRRAGSRRRATTSTRPPSSSTPPGTTAAPRPVELTYGNLAVERARLGRRARPRPRRALAVRAAARRTSAACRSCCARAIYATTAVVHERFETDRVLRRAARRSGSRSSASSPRRSRACSTPACERPPALRCALHGGGPVPRRARRARAGARACRSR